MPDGRYIAYYRVSTTRQGESGLGLEAQQKAVAAYLNGGNWQIIEEYTEIESGKRNNRPTLAAAIVACKKHKATLIIAKLDRLARNVHFISGLMEAGIEFVAVDNPNANKLMLHMLAAFAEHEREMISKRTKEALAAAKERGVKLGRHGAEVLSKRNREASLAYYAEIAPKIRELQASGHHTTRALCDALNASAIPTMRGIGKWHIPQVHKVGNAIG